MIRQTIKSSILSILSIFTLVFVLGCIPQPKGEPEREADIPQRKIEEPLKAERITDAEYRKAELSADEGNIGLLDEPMFPFDIEKKYVFTIMKEGTLPGMRRWSSCHREAE